MQHYQAYSEFGLTSRVTQVPQILHRYANQPEVEDKWWALLNWPAEILQLPKKRRQAPEYDKRYQEPYSRLFSKTQLTVESKTQPR
jgi:hypothetical protein